VPPIRFVSFAFEVAIMRILTSSMSSGVIALQFVYNIVALLLCRGENTVNGPSVAKSHSCNNIWRVLCISFGLLLSVAKLLAKSIVF
jgi:hypothetical protein